MPRSRRTLLKTAGLALSGGTLASFAGCLSDSSDGAESTSDTTSTTTSRPTQSEPTSMPDFARWLPDPTEAPLRAGYDVLYFDLEGIHTHRDAIHENAYTRLEEEMLRPVSDDLEDVTTVDATLQIDRMPVALGSFDPEAFGEQLNSGSQSSTETTVQRPPTPTESPETVQSPTKTSYWAKQEGYKGFEFYGTEFIYAISEEALLLAGPLRGDPIERLKAIIDASEGVTSHYADSNEYVSSMLGVVDDSHALWCYPNAMDGSSSNAFRNDIMTGLLKSWQFGPETTQLTWATTYPDAETAESGDLSDYIESESARFGAYDGLDVKIDGLMAWTDGTIPTKEFDFLTAGKASGGVTTTGP